MKDQYNYRLAVHKDIKQLQQLGLMAYGRFAETLGDGHWGKMEANMKDENTFGKLLDIATGFVCEMDDDIIGMAFLIPHGHATPIFLPEWSYIRLVGVHPQHGGKGIGKKLTRQCIDHARVLGEQTIALHTSEFMDAARHIYESLGFERQKEIDPIFGKKYFLYTLGLNHA